MPFTPQDTSIGILETTQGKVCSICSVFKPYDDFYANKTYKDGYTNKCRQCVSQQRKERLEKKDLINKLCNQYHERVMKQ